MNVAIRYYTRGGNTIKSTYKQITKLLAEKHIPLAEEEFACKGSFGVMHKGKPDTDDCKAAAAFAKKIVS